MQNAAIANDADGRHGIEADNNEFGFRNLPQTRPRICNVTVVGAKDQTRGANLGADGARLRRGTGGLVSNAIFTEWSGDGIDLRRDVGSTCESACDGRLEVVRSLLHDNARDGCRSDCGGVPCDPCAAWAADGLVAADPGFGGVTPSGDAGVPSTVDDTTDGRYFPSAVGPANETAPCPHDPSFFEAAGYIGAFDPDGDPSIPGDADNWLLTDGAWISFAVH